MTKSLRKNVPDTGSNPWTSGYQADTHPTELAGPVAVQREKTKVKYSLTFDIIG